MAELINSSAQSYDKRLPYLNGNTSAAEKIRITVTLTAEELAFLDNMSPFYREGAHVGERNRSEGIRSALLAYKREVKELLALHRQRSAEMKADPSIAFSDNDLEIQIAAKIAAQAVHVEN